MIRRCGNGNRLICLDVSLIVCALAFCGLSSPSFAQQDAERTAMAADGATGRGSQWLIERPRDWNGTLLLWSHGWWRELRAPENAPPGMRESLLDAGYALAGSTYSATGWAVAEAVPDQIELLEIFAARFGDPSLTIAWGNSMGGLVTTTLAERYGEKIAGALTMCASSGGALGMMNSGLDGAFAFAELVAPDAGIRVVSTQDDADNAARVSNALDAALRTPSGRARVALASVLAGLPGWTQRDRPRPDAADFAGQAAQMAASFVFGVMLPRAEQEARAGGVFSWNTGVDYRYQLERSGRRALVEHMYALAGISLEQDLDRLNAAPRIAADADAARYMMMNATPSGAIGVPVLSLHTVGDGLTSPSLQRAYVETVSNADHNSMIAAAWNNRAGHCTSSPGEMRAALRALELRIEAGQWSVAPETLNRFARAAGESQPTFADHEPAPLMRPCVNKPGMCPGYAERR